VSPRNAVRAASSRAGGSNRPLVAVVLAAGKGKRLRSSTPKVLLPVCGRPALWHVIEAARAARPKKIVVVVSHGKEQVEAVVRSWRISPEPVFVDQGDLLGTGHAVLAAERAVGRADEVLVLGGDDPLVEGTHVRELLRVHRRTKAAATILTTEVDHPGGYGRVIREGARLVGIVEETDLTDEQRSTREMSTLVYAFRRADLFAALPLVGRDNRQREHYLPDVLPILMDKGERVSAVLGDFGGWAGVNSRETFAELTRIMRSRINGRHMERGVTFPDPSATYVDVDVEIGEGSTLHPNTFLEGATRVGRDTVIGPSVELRDSTVGDRSEISFAVISGARIGDHVTVGPFVRIRPGTVLEDGAHVGAFIDMKNATVGPGSKVPHLTYVGDATIGRDSNIGAGTVTVNYDGYDKHRTVIGDEVRVGSDTMLVAPIRVGDRAVTGAGSVITQDVPAGALAVERSEQKVIPGYRERKDAEAKRRGKGRTKGSRGKGAR
jgi:bifunctional UDP-N-acetylglucosamine pyrophosphorylase / glucosamine-1-phosphate N-acetyltransferase